MRQWSYCGISGLIPERRSCRKPDANQRNANISNPNEQTTLACSFDGRPPGIVAHRAIMPIPADTGLTARIQCAASVTACSSRTRGCRAGPFHGRTRVLHAPNGSSAESAPDSLI